MKLTTKRAKNNKKEGKKPEEKKAEVNKLIATVISQKKTVKKKMNLIKSTEEVKPTLKKGK